MEGFFAMTISLAIDTSTSRTVVGIVNDETVLFEKFHEGATDHGRALSELVSAALMHNPQIDQVVVGMGPGPFTGLRVGITFARTFALARQIPVIGVCSLDAIALPASFDQHDYIIATDARRKEIYWARYVEGNRIEGPHVAKPADVAQYIIGYFPDARSLVRRSAQSDVKEPMYLRRPDAVPTTERP
jgi:tRNA threonylcarbamoyl adenosine modification protein YeaZ